MACRAISAWAPTRWLTSLAKEIGSPRVVVVRPTHGDGSVVSSVSSVSSGQIIITHQSLSDAIWWFSMIFVEKFGDCRSRKKVPFIWVPGIRWAPYHVTSLSWFFTQGPTRLMECFHDWWSFESQPMINWWFGSPLVWIFWDPRIRKGLLPKGYP